MKASPADAVILAAGSGTRLAHVSHLPKPLLPVAGHALLDYVVSALAAAEISRIFIVAGHKRAEMMAHPLPVNDGVVIRWIHNPQYHRANGVSLMAAEGHVEPPFVLLMADHLFQPDILRDLVSQPCPSAGGLLAIDRRVDGVFDLDDATKVRAPGDVVLEIGKHLETFDAIDTGMFLFSDRIFAAMGQQVRNGAEQLSAGVATLAGGGQMRTWDIGARHWIDMDTPEAWATAGDLARQGWFGLCHPGDASAGEESAR